MLHLDDEEVREAVHEHAVLRAHAFDPIVGESQAVAADRVEPHAPRVIRPDLEARRVDDAVDLVLDAGDDDALFGDAIHALAVGVEELRAGLVECLQVLVVEARPLAELAVPGLEALGGGGVSHDLVDARADLFHLLEVGVFEGAQHALGRELLGRERQDLAAHPARDVGPTVLREVFFGEHPRLDGGEVFEPALLPARLCHPGEPLGIGRTVVTDVDRRRRALHDVELLTGARELGDALHRGRAGPDHRDALVAQLLHRRAGRLTAGVRIVPAAGVERMAAELLDTGNARELRHVERPGSHRNELRREGVAAVGANGPPRAGVVPLEPGHARVEERPVVEPELPADPAAVLEDLGAVGVLLGRHVPGLLEQRHIDEGGRVALRARVAVPVPGAPEVAALLDDPHVGDADLFQTRSRDEPREAAADDRDRHVIGLGLARSDRGVGILEIAVEFALDLDVLIVGVGAKALGALLGVLVLEGFLVDGAHGAPPRWDRRKPYPSHGPEPTSPGARSRAGSAIRGT